MPTMSSLFPLPAAQARPPCLGGLVGALFARQPVLAGTALVMVGLTLPTLAAYAFDARMLAGANVWLKPLKFELAFALYFATLAWLWGYLPRVARQRRFLSTYASAAAATAFLELGYIILQAARGVPSHFNESTPVEAVLFALMGAGSLVIMGTSLVLAVALMRHRDLALAPAFREAIILGLVLTFVLGTGTGLAIVHLGGPLIGGSYGDEGWPFFGWSLEAGDLRVAHFFGLHALQLLPLIGYAAARLPRGKMMALRLGASAYAGWTLWVFAEALAGRPVLHWLV
jgi:hypothetical protein